MLIELGVVEQRHKAVLEVLAGSSVVEVAERYGVSRQTLHRWLQKYARSGIGGLADASPRPARCPHSTPPAARGAHRRAAPRPPPLGAAHDRPLPGPGGAQGTIPRAPRSTAAWYAIA